MGLLTLIAGAAVGTATTVVAAPLILGAVGFTAGGIAVSSYAASMMSAAAVANGGAVASGSLVAVCQSAGVLGIPAAVQGVIGAVGALGGAGTAAAAAILI